MPLFPPATSFFSSSYPVPAPQYHANPFESSTIVLFTLQANSPMLPFRVNQPLHPRQSPRRIPFRHRDENPVTATPLDSALTNCDARKPFRIRPYKNCRVSPSFFPFWNSGSGLSTCSPRSPVPLPYSCNSNGIISFADPHPINPIESYRSKKGGGEAGQVYSEFCHFPSPFSPIFANQLLHSCKFTLLFSTTSRLPLPQLLCFQSFALLPGGVPTTSPIPPRDSRPTRGRAAWLFRTVRSRRFARSWPGRSRARARSSPPETRQRRGPNYACPCQN